MKISQFFFGGFFFFFFLIGWISFSVSSFAAENVAYTEIDVALLEVEKPIESSEKTGELCQFAFGNRAQIDIKKYGITFVDTVLEIWEGKEKSICFLQDVRKIDQRIDRAMKNFPKTKASCSFAETQIFVEKMKKILDQRRKFRFENTKKDYKKEYCSENPEEKIFSETIQAWEKFQLKLQEIEKSIAELKQSDFSPSQLQKKEIDYVAKQTAKIYYEQFWSTLDIAAGMREARAKVNRSHKGLPHGNSRFVELQNIFGEVTEDKNEIPQKTAEFQKKQWENASPLLESRTEILKKIEQEKIIFDNAFATNMQLLEQTEDFSSPLSSAIVDSLERFHDTTNDTKNHLDALTEALSTVISAQNVER